MKILVVDDEKLIRDVIREYIENEGFEVIEAVDGIDALEKFDHNNISLVIMDIMMPNLDGFSAINEIRKSSNVPVIVLSARSEEYDKLSGFDLGIDDYITKPFSPKELIARIKAVLKRNMDVTDYLYIDSNFKIDLLGRVVYIDDKEVALTPKEFDLLVFLIQNKNIAISREQLLSKIWGYNFYGDARTIDTHVKMLRNNIGRYRDLIITVRGIGYKFEKK